MKYINSIKTSLLIILICFITFCSGYTMGSSFVFADSTTDNWTQVTTNSQLVEAFRYYCKSRDLTIDGSIADGVTKFTTKTFNGICNSLGIDVTALQAHLKYETDGNLGLRFLFDTTGISAYNQIFAQFLQDNNLEVGDSVNNEVIYSNDWFVDNSGNGCFVYYLNSNVSSSGGYTATTNFIALGTPYIYESTQDLLNNLDTSVSNIDTLDTSAGTTTYTYYFRTKIDSRSISVTNAKTLGGTYTFGYYDLYDNTTQYFDGTPAIIKWNGLYYFGAFGTDTDHPNNYTFAKYQVITFNGNQPQNVNITINSTTINNNNYEGDTIINNNGTPSEPATPLPLPEPDYNPAEDWDIDLPDLSIPNWILSGKENKFPFDIPFNVMYALSLLQAEPEAPRVEGTLDFGFTTWEYDLDLSDFDTVAEICRDMEFLAFLTGLMLMTRKLIWG